MRSYLARSCSALVVIALSLFVSGCTGTWTGKGKEVAAAIEQSAQVKTARFSASIEMKFSGGPGQANTADSFLILMSGAADQTDPNNPRMKMTMESPTTGDREQIVMPGDGRVYATTNGKSYSFPAPDAKEYAMENGRVLSALGASVGGFRESQPMTNIKEEQVPAIYATVDKGKLCGPVLDSFGDAFKTGASEGASDLSEPLGVDPTEGISGLCKAVIRKDPSVWFGISNGLLTDVALSANLVFPMGMTMSMTMQYHEYNQGKRIGRMRVPATVTNLGSEAEFEQVS